MEEKRTYAEQLMKKVKEQQQKEDIDYFNVVNNIENGYVIVNYAKEELEEKVLMDGKIAMLCLKSFHLMDSAIARIKYPDEDRPNYIYTSKDTTVNFNFSLEIGAVVGDEIEEIKNLLKKEMLRLYAGSKLEDDEMLETCEKKKVGLFSMEIPTIDGSVYQATFFQALNEGLLIGGFNCNSYDKKEWKPILKQLLTTVKEIKKVENV